MELWNFGTAQLVDRMGRHLIRVSVGLVSLLIAAFAPLRLAPIAPMAYALMGPAHFTDGWRSGSKRQVLEEQLAGETRVEISVS